MTDLNPRPTLDQMRPCPPIPPRARQGLAGRSLSPRAPGDLPVRRFLPAAGHRCVGAWGRFDEWGPHPVGAGTPLVFGTHPHTGADVLTLVLAGELNHRDNLGNHVLVRPGTLLLMSAGEGMTHAQDCEGPQNLHALELWAMTAGTHVEPGVQVHAQNAILQLPGLTASVLVGELAGVRSPVLAHADVNAALVDVEPGAGMSASTCWLPLRRTYEHALLVLDGDLRVDEEDTGPGVLLYLGTRHGGLDLRSRTGARAVLIGGTPLTRTHTMWWNFVTTGTDELVSARALWSAHAPRFGKVPGDRGRRWPTPPVVGIPVRHPHPPRPPGPSPSPGA